jgi:hypothetical protein
VLKIKLGTASKCRVKKQEQFGVIVIKNLWFGMYVTGGCEGKKGSHDGFVLLEIDI